MMRVFFRADANSEIGSGHLMRCLTLAKALKAQGAECSFLARAKGIGALGARIRDEGFAFPSLPDVDTSVAASSDGLVHSHSLPGGYAADVARCEEMLGNVPPADWPVVDQYALDFRWEAAIGHHARHVLAIDDLADRCHDCALLLDQNLMPDAAHRYDALVASSCERLLGDAPAPCHRSRLPRRITRNRSVAQWPRPARTFTSGGQATWTGIAWPPRSRPSDRLRNGSGRSTLRVADPDRYPAFVEFRGRKYAIRMMPMEPLEDGDPANE